MGIILKPNAQGLQDTNEGQAFNILLIIYNKMNEQENSNL